MEDLYNSIMQQQVDVALFIGALVVSLIVAFFHYMIFTGLYKINLGKYFFAVLSDIVGGSLFYSTAVYVNWDR